MAFSWNVWGQRHSDYALHIQNQVYIYKFNTSVHDINTRETNKNYINLM